MTNRYRAILAFALLPVAIAGCDDYEFTAPNPTFAVSPTFTSIDEGTSVQLTATDAAGNPVAVSWASDNTSIVTVNSSGLAFGAGPGVTAVIATLGSEKLSSSITVNQLQGIGIQKGVPVTGLSGAARGNTRLYRIFVPAGTTNLKVTLTGPNGDADLYMRRGSPPVGGTGDACIQENGGTAEQCSINNPQSGTWYMLVATWDPYTNATLTATYTP
jgi:hypothetical protein